MRARLLQQIRGVAGELPFPRVVVAATVAVVVGLTLGRATDPASLINTPGYLYLAGILLAVGLYGSTHDIDLGEIRQDRRVLVLAVTLGVLLKALLISAVLVLIFREPEYLVLGIAVAQIDPLSVAAMNKSRRMSSRAKSLLAAWASFDDPMTVLLTLYFSVVAFRLSDRSGTPTVGTADDGATAFLAGLGWNLTLLLAVLALWGVSRGLGNRTRHSTGLGQRATPKRSTPLFDGICLMLAVLLIVVAAGWMLMLAVAVAGLFLRVGRYGRLIQHAVSSAFVLAALILGLLLAHGVSPWRGLVLGVAAFGAQALIGLLIAPRLIPGLDRNDRVSLGLGQQNGITAIILALALEPDFPGTVAIVGPAILTVNTCYYASNGLWAAWQNRHGAERPPENQSGARNPCDQAGVQQDAVAISDTATP